MAIILRKNVKEVSLEQAVTFKKDLPIINETAKAVRYVQSENIFYIYNGITWQEVDLIIGE